MKKLGNLFIGFIGFLIGVQIIQWAIAPYLPFIGFIMTAAIVCLILAGLGFSGYVLYQRVGKGTDDSM